jgi:hypothetical protein
MDDLEEKRGYWKMKEEAIIAQCGRGYGPVVRQTTE